MIDTMKLIKGVCAYKVVFGFVRVSAKHFADVLSPVSKWLNLVQADADGI